MLPKAQQLDGRQQRSHNPRPARDKKYTWFSVALLLHSAKAFGRGSRTLFELPVDIEPERPRTVGVDRVPIRSEITAARNEDREDVAPCFDVQSR